MTRVTPRTLKQRILIRRAVQALIILGIFLMAITNINHENDIFWQLRMGEEIWTKHYFPIRDPFSLPAQGEVWTLHEWLPSLIFYLVFTYLGPWALIIFKAILVAATFGLFLVIFNRLKVNLYLSIFILLMAAMINTRGIWMVFPSLFEYFFIAITLLFLEDYTSSKNQLIIVLLSLLSLIWANSHGSFFALTAIVGSYLLGDIASHFLKKRWSWYQPAGVSLTTKQRWSLLVLIIVSAVTPFFTPNGVWTFLYPFRISFGGFSTYVSEYQKFWQVWHWDWTDFVYSLTIILSALLLALFAFSYRRLHPRDLAMGIFFVALSIMAVRHVAVFALVALFLAGKYIAVWFGEYRGVFARRLTKDVLALFLIICFVYFYKTRLVPFGFVLSEENYPAKLAEMVNASGIPGNMFNHYNYGGYLIWKMPKYKVFVDGRLEMYIGRVGKDYLTILEAKPGYQALLDKYQINFMIDYLQDPITEQLLAGDNTGWRYVATDDQYVLLVKDSPANKGLLDKYWTSQKQADFVKLYKKDMAMFRAKLLNDMGVAKMKQKKLYEALSDLQRAEEYNPDAVDVRLNLASTYILIGSTILARTEYNEVLRIDPRNETAKKGLEILKKSEETKINIY